MSSAVLEIGEAVIRPDVRDGELRSFGAVEVRGVPLRNPATRFLPWFDGYEGDVFRRFLWQGVERRGEQTVIRVRAISDPDAMFRERRDSSGDPCFRSSSWDAAPMEGELRVVLSPASAEIDGRRFAGFRYGFEMDSPSVPVHRLVDRQTWELGGGLDDVTICLRNWLTPARMRLSRDAEYSTVGLGKWMSLMPGNLWARWSLLPPFDLQYGRAGVLVAWFDRVSLIRTVIETARGEDALRCLDMHLFPQACSAATNPKTILFSPDRLDDVDAMNLWTRLVDAENAKARRQFGIRREPADDPPAIVFSENHWRGFRLEGSYDRVLDAAAELGGEYIFIDPPWQNMQAFQETLADLLGPDKLRHDVLGKFRWANMCCTLDFEVAEIFGGEEGLKRLCDAAARRGVKVMSWMAAHYTPSSALTQDRDPANGRFGIIATKESGLHPDTGYPGDCWTMNLNTSILERLREQLLGICRRTGLAGFLWDSFSNLGWWQVDYSRGDMRPQFDRMAQLYADLVNAGLYLMPEGMAAFSNASCLGLMGGDVYEGDLLGFSYNTNVSLHPGESGEGAAEKRIITGEEPIDLLFRCLAHRRAPCVSFQRVPREQWHAGRVEEIRELFATYRRLRGQMRRRTVLKDDAGVEWEDGQGGKLLFSFRARKLDGRAVDASTGQPAPDGVVQPNRVYRLAP